MSDDLDTISVLRISTEDDLLEEVLSLFPPHRIDASWIKGERRAANSVRETAGANILLTENASVRSAIERTMLLVERRRDAFQRLRELGASATIDIGVSVDPTHWARSARFRAEELQLFASLGLNLEITSYASGRNASDDDDDAPLIERSTASDSEDDVKKNGNGADDSTDENK